MAWWTIAKREFRSNFDSPLAYVVICASFLMLGAGFFFVDGGFWQIGRATMQPLFRFLAMGLVFLVAPVVTMRLMSEERRSGTLEMLITLPLKDSDVILGKYLGAMGMVGVVLVASLAYPVAMFVWPWSLGPLDMGPVLSGYVGVTLIALGAVALGLMVSSFTKSQSVAFFVSLFIMSCSWFAGDAARVADGKLADFFHYVSIQSRLGGFMRGLIDVRDVVFFLSITILCLIISFRALERRKWA